MTNQTVGAMNSRSTVQSVRRACMLLQAMQDAEPQSALELARATGLDRTVVHRLLRTLVDEGLAEQDRSGFSLGPRTVALGHAYLDHLRLRQAALPYATALHAALEGTPWFVGLSAPAWDAVVIVDELWHPQSPLDAVVRIGTRLPIADSATGRCLLAYAPVPGLKPSLQFADRRLDERLAAIRERGGIEFSRILGDSNLSVIACVILSRSHAPIGVLAVAGAGLEAHFFDGSELMTRIRNAARGIGSTLS